MVLLQPDPFLNELTSMYERNRDKGSVWVTLKRSCLRSKGKRKSDIDASEYKCLVRATDGEKTISTVASYSTVLKAHMDALKKRERKDKKKVAEADKQKQSSKTT